MIDEQIDCLLFLVPVSSSECRRPGGGVLRNEGNVLQCTYCRPVVERFTYNTAVCLSASPSPTPEPTREGKGLAARRTSSWASLPEGRKRAVGPALQLQASLPVVDNNREVVGALSVVGEKFSKILAALMKICKTFRYF